MAFETTLGELMRQDTIDANKILSELLSEKNIDMKTHILTPIEFAILESTVNNLESMLFETKGKLPITTKLLRDIIRQLKKFMVSWQRLSRKEITETLQAAKQQEVAQRSLFGRLTGMEK